LDFRIAFKVRYFGANIRPNDFSDFLIFGAHKQHTFPWTAHKMDVKIGSEMGKKKESGNQKKGYRRAINAVYMGI